MSDKTYSEEQNLLPVVPDKYIDWSELYLTHRPSPLLPSEHFAKYSWTQINHGPYCKIFKCYGIALPGEECCERHKKIICEILECRYPKYRNNLCYKHNFGPM